VKNLARSLGITHRQCLAQDDDALDGVYATPGPRAQGDEASEAHAGWSVDLTDLQSPPHAADAFEDPSDPTADEKSLS
jgi:hypothetical protein